MPRSPDLPVPAERAPLPAPETRSIVLGGAAIPYVLRVSARARRISLRISPASGLEVVLPRGVGVARAEALLREKAEWVHGTLERMRRAAPPTVLPPLVDGRVLPYAGRTVRLRIHTGTPAGRYRAALDGDTLTLTVSALEEGTIRAALEGWYRRQAAAVFAERLAVCNRFGFAFGRVAIKEQKSRWGSCSRSGNLNFNWRLLLAPLAVLDYVVMHELAHLGEANHGPRFWALLATVCPEHRERRRWLKVHGHELRF